VTEVHWRIIANLGFKFRSHFTVLLAVLLAGGSSRAMLASARSLVNIPTTGNLYAALDTTVIRASSGLMEAY